MNKVYRILYLMFAFPLMMLLSACGVFGGEAIEVGKNAPKFTLQSASGENVSLSDYSGQPVLLYFHMAVG